jgi:hypothetical protein
MPLFGMDGKQSHDSLFGQDGLPLRHRVTTMGAVFGKEGKYLTDLSFFKHRELNF